MWSIILSALDGLFSLVDKLLGNSRRADEQAHGARKSELERREKVDEIEDDAEDVWDRPDDGRIDLADRVRRNDGDNRP